MKKLLVLLLVLMLTASAALAEPMIVYITSTCYDVNYVGKNWQGRYYISDLEVYDGMIVDLDVAKYNVYSEIGDDDFIQDKGSAETQVNVTENKLIKGFTVDQYLTVTENAGTYRGYWNEWYITYTFVPAGTAVNLYVIH